MANIQNYLNQIKTAVFGKDVRESIHNAIKQCYDDAAVNHDNANMEVKLARGSYNTLNDRLDENEKVQENFSSQLDKIETEMATKEEVSSISKRMDSFTSLKEGSTTGDAELIDGRTSNDGITYKNIGGHIRSKFANIENIIDVDEYYKSESISILTGVMDKWNNLNSALGKHFEVNVNAGDKFRITGYVYNSNYPLIIEYNSSGAVIGSVKGDVNDTQITDYSYTVTNGNVAKIIVNGYLTLGLKKCYKKKIKDTINSISNNICEQKISENNEYVAIKVYEPISVTIENNVISSGGQSTTIGKHCTISVSEGEEYLITGYVYNSSYPLILKKFNGTIIGYEKNDLTETLVTDYYFKVPSGVDSLVINSNNSIVVKKRTIVNSKEYIDNSMKSYWYGKKIAWFGTSIPAGGYVGLNNSNSYPMMIGKMLGATVYNEAIGSSSMCCRKKSQITEKNPYGFNGNYEQVSRCLTNTIEEMQWVIDNWDSDIWTSNKPTSKPSGSVAQQILDNSYENKLMRRLGDGRCDLYVIDHGHNEVWESSALQQPTDDMYDRSTVQGAFNFIIGKILTDNPKARILLIGEYEDQRNPWVKQVQTVCADYWNLPIMPLWDLTGWSQRIINGKTILNTWLPDNIHPHSDTTGQALNYLKNIIGNWIDKNMRLIY